MLYTKLFNVWIIGINIYSAHTAELDKSSLAYAHEAPKSSSDLGARLGTCVPPPTLPPRPKCRVDLGVVWMKSITFDYLVFCLP